jgi:hypothetical protein
MKFIKKSIITNAFKKYLPRVASRQKLVIFDLGQTLMDETIYLKHLMASYNPYTDFFCERYNITTYTGFGLKVC